MKHSKLGEVTEAHQDRPATPDLNAGPYGKVGAPDVARIVPRRWRPDSTSLHTHPNCMAPACLRSPLGDRP